MKIAPDQNSITLSDGTVLVSAGVGHCRDSSKKCNDCYLMWAKIKCSRIPCSEFSRQDGKSKIFILKTN